MSFVVQHLAIFALLVVGASAAGNAVAGARFSPATRFALGLAVAGQVFVALAALKILNAYTLAIFLAVALFRSPRAWMGGARGALFALPVFALALYPPLAFDETLYHLPFVRALAESGAFAFRTDLRFPIFPQLHEALCVPPFLLGGDTATHLVSVVELIALGGIVYAWGRERGLLALALVVATPIALHLGSITYVDLALALFVTAGFFCLEREDSIAAAAFFFGTACSVKYLGWFFAAAGAVYVLAFRRKELARFAIVFAASVVPMFATILAFTGNPVFPFFGSSPWRIAVGDHARSLVDALRVPFDATFARGRLNQQPPYSPLFALSLLATCFAARRDRRALFVAVTCIVYLAIFTRLPQDSRYLLPLLPLVSVIAAQLVPKRIATALAIAAFAGGLAYAGYRFMRLGPLPVTPAQRAAFLRARIPEYRALERREGAGRVYLCGAEQLKYFAGDDAIGDVEGPYTQIPRTGIAYVLASKRACRQTPPANFVRVYEDEGAVLWRAVDSR